MKKPELEFIRNAIWVGRTLNSGPTEHAIELFNRHVKHVDKLEAAVRIAIPFFQRCAQGRVYVKDEANLWLEKYGGLVDEK